MPLDWMGFLPSPWCEQVAPDHAGADHPPCAATRVALTPLAQGAFGAAGTDRAVQSSRAQHRRVRHGHLRSHSEFTLADDPVLRGRQRAAGRYRRRRHARHRPGLPGRDSTTIVVKTVLPDGAAVGASNEAHVTAISSRNPAKMKTASFQAGVPALFAQSFSQSGRPKVGFYRPDQQATRQTTGESGYSPAVATAPDGADRPGVESGPLDRRQPLRLRASTTRCWTTAAT